MRRAALWQEHYRAQEQDASKLTAENRLLLERVHQLSTALDEHKKEVEALRNDNVHQAAALKVRLLQRRRPSAAPRAAPRCTLQGRSLGAEGLQLGCMGLQRRGLLAAPQPAHDG